MYKYEMTSTFIIVDQTDTLLLVLVVLDGGRRQRNKNVIVRSPLPSADDVRPVPVQGKEEKTDCTEFCRSLAVYFLRFFIIQFGMCERG